MLPKVGEKVELSEPVYKVGSLFMWSGNKLDKAMPPFVITGLSPVGMQHCDGDPIIWDWQYQLHYLNTPVKKTFYCETEIKSLIRATELQLISEGDNPTRQ